jgi:hypothetical protein
MRHGHSRRSRRMMPPEIAGWLLASLRPTRHLLTRSLADMPIGRPGYRQVDRVVQEIDGLARILAGDATYLHRSDRSAEPTVGTGRTERERRNAPFSRASFRPAGSGYIAGTMGSITPRRPLQG